ncbi:hypothetical protein Plhal710r2_c016g0070611 [Plasmopara halstedii]
MMDTATVDTLLTASSHLSLCWKHPPVSNCLGNVHDVSSRADHPIPIGLLNAARRTREENNFECIAERNLQSWSSVDDSNVNELLLL